MFYMLKVYALVATENWGTGSKPQSPASLFHESHRDFTNDLANKKHGWRVFPQFSITYVLAELLHWIEPDEGG
jgi:hypothetical protein